MGGHPFLALQAQGLEGDEKPLDMIEEMADQHLRSLRQIQPTGPYDLGGWSLGGLIAFEMARRLEAAGEDVGTLALFDSRLDAAHGTGISDEWPALLEAYLQ